MTNPVIPEAAVEALARVLAGEALFDADCSGSGWNAETASSDHFMPRARTRATEYLEAAAPHMTTTDRPLEEQSMSIEDIANDIRDIPVAVVSGPAVDLTDVLARHLHKLGYQKAAK